MTALKDRTADGAVDACVRALRADIRNAMAESVVAPLPDPRFNALALRVFAHQFNANAPYGAFCRARGRTPATVQSWTDVPVVPTTAFKRLPLVAGRAADAAATFHTSGTTGGEDDRGAHYVLDLGLYHASLLSSFRRHVLPDERSMPILALVPSPEGQPGSSLSHMAGTVMDACAAPGSGYWVDPVRGLDVRGFGDAARRVISDGLPALVFGTAFSFVHLLDAMDEMGWSLALPPGSRVMETGGFKGRSREMSRADLYAGIGRTLGVTPRWIVNEYGMTEMLSQFYDGVAGVAGEDRIHRPPAWVRSRVLDPVSLRPAIEGEAGLLCHFDLANVDSVSAVLTEDLGAASGGGVRVLGRAAGAEPRGCSIAMDDLLAAAGRVR